MNKVIVTDIFGRTREIDALARAVGSVTTIIDPYDGKNLTFAAESTAHECFMTHVGIPAYGRLVATRLAEIQKIDLIIGFSVGAAAVWGISSTIPAQKIDRAVCFYGAQIRHATEVVPGFPMVHILPEKEPGFDIDGLAETLSRKPAVTIHKTGFLHGFMNPLSPNFNQAGYDDWLDRLRRDQL